MIGSFLSVFGFCWENNADASSHTPDVMLTESTAPALIFSSTTPKTPPKKNAYRQLCQQLQDLSYTEEEVKRLLLPLEQPHSFTATEAWFNDSLVNDYFQQLATQYPNLEVISSLMTQCETSLPDRLRTWSKYREWKMRLSQSSLVFWPIHQADHWHLIVIDNRSREANVYLLDGFNTKNKDILTGYGFELASVIRSELPTEHMSGEFISVAAQKNIYDCGSVICFYAKLIAEFYSKHRQLPELSVLNTSNVDYTDFRKNIAETLRDFGASVKSVSRSRL